MNSMLLGVAFVLFSIYSGNSMAAPEFIIQGDDNDEHFIINGELFSAQTYCLGWKKGDRVVLLEGDASGACATATFYNRRTQEICELWCGK
jgi:hypothetical protein